MALGALGVLEGFERSPWLEQWLEFHFKPSFLYRHYPYVQGGYNPKNYSSHDRFTNLDLHTAPFETLDVELLIELADTRKQKLGMQSAGGQIRYIWLDDFKGDFASLTTHVNLRYVSFRSLHDVSCPYHGRWNIELGQSIGKEWESSLATFKPWCFLSIGQANFGYPWIAITASLEALFRKVHRLSLALDGYFGLGHQTKVNVNDFYGWGKIRHQDLEASLRYTFAISKIWGEVSFFYGYRFFAKNYPAKASTYVIEYHIPFSML